MQQDSANRPLAGSVMHARQVFQCLLAAWLVLGGLAFAWTACATIATYGWEYPTQDQYRLYRHYLERPFPQNVLQVENQHRPIVPGLVRVAEIHWCDADQQLQIAVGLGCALLAAALLSLASLENLTRSLALRCAGVTAAFVAIFWLGNARMLLHGNELVHTYAVVLACVVVAASAWRAARGAPGRWMAAGTVAATLATFSFGPGIALFPTLAVLAFAQRVPLRWLAIPLLGCVVCLLLYVFVLPGDDNVRLGMSFRPADMATISIRWLASPWINAWLCYAEPAMFPWHADLIAVRSGWLVTSANAVQTATGLTWSNGLALGFGAAGLSVMAAGLWRSLRAGRPLSRLETTSLALMLFGAGCAAIIGIGRVGLLLERPDQIFADRYLPWPCVFWLGVGSWLLTSRFRAVRGTTVAFIAWLPFLLWPTHELGAGWGASVHRGVQATAAAARAGVIDPDVFWRDDPSVLFDDKLRTLQLLRDHGLAMFALPGTRSLGMRWESSLESADGIITKLSTPTPVRDVRTDVAGARIEGMFESGGARISHDAILVVLDSAQRIVGYGERSFDPTGSPKLRWSALQLQGFDVFIRDYDPAASYRLAALDFSARSGVLLGTIPLP